MVEINATIFYCQRIATENHFTISAFVQSNTSVIVAEISEVTRRPSPITSRSEVCFLFGVWLSAMKLFLKGQIFYLLFYLGI